MSQVSISHINRILILIFLFSSCRSRNDSNYIDLEKQIFTTEIQAKIFDSLTSNNAIYLYNINDKYEIKYSDPYCFCDRNCISVKYDFQENNDLLYLDDQLIKKEDLNSRLQNIFKSEDRQTIFVIQLSFKTKEIFKERSKENFLILLSTLHLSIIEFRNSLSLNKYGTNFRDLRDLEKVSVLEKVPLCYNLYKVEKLFSKPPPKKNDVLDIIKE